MTIDEADFDARKRELFGTLLSHFAAHVKINERWSLAEFGIGKGGFGRFYKDHFLKVYGIDIRDFSAHHPGVEFVISDGRSIPMEDASVHVVASHSVLEHVGDLKQSIAEIDRITRPGGYLFLTVTPLYYSAYGAHLHDAKGRRLDNWDHLNPRSAHYLTINPITNEPDAGHDLNLLTSERFLAAVGTVPWSILSYDLSFENKPVPPHVDRARYSELDLRLRGFRFIGQKHRLPML